jgi:hypothetical protein
VLPLGGVAASAAAQYRAALAGVRAVNGASGYGPPHLLALGAAIARRQPDALWPLAERGPLCVAVDAAAPGGHELARWLTSARDPTILARPPGSTRGHAFFRLEARTPLPRPAPGGEPLVLQGIQPSSGRLERDELVDGDPATGWITPEHQRAGDALVLRLGCEADVAGVRLSQGVFAGGFARALAVDVAAGPSPWRTAWQGSLEAQGVGAALDDPRLPIVSIAASMGRADRLRLRVRRPAPAHWAVAEVEVRGRCGPPSAP